MSERVLVACAVQNLVCLHTATFPGNTPCYRKLSYCRQTSEDGYQSDLCFVSQITLLWFDHDREFWVGACFGIKHRVDENINPIFGQCNVNIVQQNILQIASLIQHLN